MALTADDLSKLGIVYPRDALLCDLSTPCDESPSRSGKGGYGTERRSGSAKLMHRIAYAEHRGVSLESLDGVMVRHLCHNSTCRNPLHLAAGSNKDNCADTKHSNRLATVRGEKKANAILTESRVLSARAEFVPWNREHGASALARRYGVTLSAMHDALSGRKWKHVA